MLKKVFAFTAFTILVVQVQSAIVPTTNYTQKKTGICHLEVPTIDLIDESERNGPIPQGNGTRPGFSTIQICCSGYTLQPHTAHHCIPVCANGCEHGNCTAPNICECHRGYVKDLVGECVPTCPLGCAHGVCTSSGLCSCNAGYELEPIKRQFCSPVCRNGCGAGGVCSGPEVCECKPGLQKSPRGICEQHCDLPCLNGECVGSNECSCRPGFKLQPDRKSCVAECSGGCKNGICAGPNRCTCSEGWTLDKAGTSCSPHCDQPCLNGECTGPNECACKTGYIKENFSKTRCVAHCPGGCENGTCSGPNFCICNIGYVKQAKGSNVCIKRERRSAIRYDLIPEQNTYY